MKRFYLFMFLTALGYLTAGQVKIKSYQISQISKAGLFSKTERMNEFIINSNDVKKVLDAETIQNKKQRMFKSAVPMSVDVSPLQIGKWEDLGQFSICRLKITAEGAASISIYFDKLSLEDETEIYLYNPQGTTITGPITKNENINNKLWGSNEFSGEALIIEIKIPTRKKEIIELHICKILFGVVPNERLNLSWIQQ